MQNILVQLPKYMPLIIFYYWKASAIEYSQEISSFIDFQNERTLNDAIFVVSIIM